MYPDEDPGRQRVCGTSGSSCVAVEVDGASIVADADTQEILRAAIVGTSGDEAVQTLTDAMYAKLPYTAVQRGVRIHPMVSELIPTVPGEMQPAAS